MKNTLQPIGKWISVQTKGLGGQKVIEQGIIYTEKIRNKHIWSTVMGLGDKITEDIKIGDRVLWDLTQGKGRGYGSYDVVHQDSVLAVERDAE